MSKTKSTSSRHGCCLIKGLMTCVLLAVTISVVQVVALKWLPVHLTPFMMRQQVEALLDNRPYVVRHEWVPLEQISDNMVRAVMASEDNLFQVHHGFSEQGIRNALVEKLQNGEVRHGGSTISQQTAKNIFTFGTRTYLRKAVEAYYTVLIEAIWGKERIMEVYLNIIETAEAVYGVEAISQEAFGHSAATLSTSEAARIAVCLPNPKKMHVDNPSRYVRKRQRQIERLMPKLGRIDIHNKENSAIYRQYNK